MSPRPARSLELAESLGRSQFMEFLKSENLVTLGRQAWVNCCELVSMFERKIVEVLVRGSERRPLVWMVNLIMPNLRRGNGSIANCGGGRLGDAWKEPWENRRPCI